MKQIRAADLFCGAGIDYPQPGAAAALPVLFLEER